MRKNNVVRIGIAGGGTGGHIYPLLAVCDALSKKRGPYDDTLIEFHYFGRPGAYQNEFDFRSIRVHSIIGSRLRRYASIQNIFDIPKFFISIVQALFSLLSVMPDVVFSKGGPGSIPVVFAAWFYRIPIIIHESDAVPGLANRVAARFARKICISFPESKEFFDEKKVVATGNPIRDELMKNRMSKVGAKNFWRMDEHLPLALVIGGSQGSQRINSFITENLEELLKDIQILHQVGQGNYQEIEMSMREIMALVPRELHGRYRAVPFMNVEEMKNAMTAADVIVSRAGSGAIFEIASFKTPTILIPLEESAGDHQKVNAYAYSKTGYAFVLEEENMTVHTFRSRIHEMISSEFVPKNTEEQVDSFFFSQSAERIADEVMGLV
jgi:UDP-N-acetylglucosamine--N-acetylmuramyl-(pentapeptide) pyrophosphoryl-undecaprenol N-acetylglucosamine transferase